MIIEFRQLLTEMGIEDTTGIYPPVCEPNNNGTTFVKFTSEKGERDNEQGDAFAKWLTDHDYEFTRLQLEDGPSGRRKFTVVGELDIFGEI